MTGVRSISNRGYAESFFGGIWKGVRGRVFNHQYFGGWDARYPRIWLFIKLRMIIAKITYEIFTHLPQSYPIANNKITGESNIKYGNKRLLNLSRKKILLLIF